ncbi:unnamed protein product [Porites evermanni]|uniref:Epsilon-sarcoglycan n=1 Tax=Porites evermanni TaxID=104178 RepID=A0ABN8LJC6_9CNID|nr:unnamed protein product [Porites evermanni]
MTLNLAFALGFLFSCFQLSRTSNITTGATVGIFLQKELIVSEFFPSASGQTKVKFIASRLGSPDLPPWLQIEQDGPKDRAFIYGTPGPEVSSQIVLEVTAWNKEDYNTSRKEIVISIDKSKGIPRYQAEFLIRNSSIDEFLEGKGTEDFVERVKKVWRPSGIRVTSVESKLNRAGRVPIPPQKEGVYITVGGDSTYKALQSDYQGCAGLRSQANQHFLPYDIDWCKFRLMDMSKMAVVVGNVTKSAPSGEGFVESKYVAPVYDSSARDFGSDFLLILILPLLVVFVIAIILGIIFFCFREGRPKRDAETSSSQLSHHDSILRATFRLRQLSHQNGDASHNGSAGHDPGQPRESSTPYKQEWATGNGEQRMGNGERGTGNGRWGTGNGEQGTGNSEWGTRNGEQGMGNGEFPPPSQHDEEPDAPLGAPPPYRLPPQPAVNISSPDGNNQYYPGSAQGRSRYERPPPFMSSGDVH